MSYEVKGVLKNVLPIQTGTTKSGDEWKKRHQAVIDAAKLRAEKEDEIRALHK